MKTNRGFELCAESDLAPVNADEAASVVGGSLVGRLVSAFKVGWFVGTKIDQKFGLSDRISDWAAK